MTLPQTPPTPPTLLNTNFSSGPAQNNPSVKCTTRHCCHKNKRPKLSRLLLQTRVLLREPGGGQQWDSCIPGMAKGKSHRVEEQEQSVRLAQRQEQREKREGTMGASHRSEWGEGGGNRGSTLAPKGSRLQAGQNFWPTKHGGGKSHCPLPLAAALSSRCQHPGSPALTLLFAHSRGT